MSIVIIVIASLAPNVLAQEVTPTDSPTPSATPTDVANETPPPSPEATANPEAAPTVEESTAPDPTPEANPSPSPTISGPPAISTDKVDYAPGETVTLTGTQWQPAEPVHIKVDDQGGQTWSYTTDTTADAAGSFVVTFQLPSTFVAEYVVTATGPQSGTATTTFTDADLDFRAANPTTVTPKQPSQQTCPAGGAQSNPLAGAQFSNSVSSLAPSQLVLGQIVPFEVRIQTGTTGGVRFTASFDTTTSSNQNFGYDPVYKIYCAFVDTADSSNANLDGNESVAIFSNIVSVSGDQILGTFDVSGVDANDAIIVEIWLVLDKTVPATANGNVKSGLESAFSCTANFSSCPNTISTGTQTVPLNKVGEFASNDADVSITKSDTPDPIVAGNQLTYTLTITNTTPDTTANGISITDTLDANTTFVSATGPLATCSHSAGVVTCTIPGLSPAAQAPNNTTTITIVVTVNTNAPTAGTIGSGQECTQNASHVSNTSGVDLCNLVSMTTTISDDPNSANNSDSEPTNVTATVTIRVVKEVSTDGGSTFDDANTAPGPSVNEGAGVKFKFTVTNTGDQTLTNLTLTDSDFSTASCPIPSSLAPGGSFNCTITETLATPGQHVDTATASGTFGSTPASDTDDAYVSVTDLTAGITVTKDASPASLPEPGGDFTFSVNVHNDSSVDVVTIDTLSDDVYGDLDGLGDCAVPQTIAAGGDYSCSFTGSFTGQPGSQTDTVTASGTDDDAAPVSDTDDATVTLTNVASSISVVKTVDADGDTIFGDSESRPEPGGSSTFKVVVTNTSTVDSVTISSLVDDKYPSLTGLACLKGAVSDPLPVTLAPGESFTCTFTGSFTGTADDSQTDTVTASGKDDDNFDVSASDTATVTLTDVLPTIDVQKTATPSQIVEPGGSISYSVIVTNTSVEPVILSSLTDDTFGNLDKNDVGNHSWLTSTCDTGGSLGTTNATKTYSCSFTASVTGPAGTVHTNVVTAEATDDENNTASDTDDATVTILAATAKVAPTATTCEMFRDGTSADLEDLYYGVQKNKVNNVSPGVLFYYSAVSAPAAGGTVTFTVESTDDSGLFPALDVHNGQAILYNRGDCTKNRNTRVVINRTSGGGGTVKVTFTVTGAASNEQFIIGIKYDPASVVGTTVGASRPTVHYFFKTYLGALPGGSFIITSPDSVTMQPR